MTRFLNHPKNVLAPLAGLLMLTLALGSGATRLCPEPECGFLSATCCTTDADPDVTTSLGTPGTCEVCLDPDPYPPTSATVDVNTQRPSLVPAPVPAPLLTLLWDATRSATVLPPVSQPRVAGPPVEAHVVLRI